MKPGRAVVAGGSLGGLMAASLLHRAGWSVSVFEKSKDSLAGRGAGLVAHDELFRIMAAAGIDVDEIDELGISVDRRIALDAHGKVVASQAYPQMLTSWNRLFDALEQTLPLDRYISGEEVTGVRNIGTQVEIDFASGRLESADLVVAADGSRSNIRSQLFPDTQPHYAGYVAWRGLVDEKEIFEAGLGDLFPDFTFSVVKQGQMVAYPVAGQDNSIAVGRRRYNFVWYRGTTTATLQDLSTDESGKYWKDGIPPPLIRQSVQDHMRQVAKRELPPQLATVVQLARSLFFQPISDMKSNHIASGRVVLLGDAAFVARPHSGMGVTKAAQDAFQLITSLGSFDKIEGALTDYQSRRLTFGNHAVDVGRRLGAYMEARDASVALNEMAKRYADPRNVLADTAMPLMCSYE